MSRFTYTSLSSQDFEELTRDVLQAEWEVSLEAFRNGRDQGIDLRYSRPFGKATIIQCKHFAGSGFPSLLSHLRNRELPKIKRLNPDRYILATSLALSPPNKTAIRLALHPFVVHDSDIYSAGDIDGILSRYPDVARTNYKLWLSNTQVLDRVIHNAEICHAEFIVERIKRRIRQFVQCRSFAQAHDVLLAQRVVVISGVPGIGKTTLAEMLLYEFLDKGYEPVVIQSEITEGKSLYRKGRKQIFYFDDFLGQFFPGDRSWHLSRNQDVALVNFIEMVRDSETAYFVLTTREHMLRQALASSERLRHGRLLDARYILELRDYSFGDKARILYNHIYFSDLPIEYRNELLRESYFLSIIRHSHFNPRLIEWISSYTRVLQTPPSGYQQFISNLLSSPHELWQHAFRNQLSDAAQDVLLAFYSLGQIAETADVELAWNMVHDYRSQKYNRPKVSHGIRPVLQELDGAFLSYSRGHVQFINPSVREFVASSITSERSIAADVIESATQFKQIVNLYRLSQSSSSNALGTFIKGDFSQFLKTLARLLDAPEFQRQHTEFGNVGRSIDLSLEARIEFALELALAWQSREIAHLAVEACVKLSKKMADIVDFGRTIQLFRVLKQSRLFMDAGGRSSYRSILDRALDLLVQAKADDWLSLFRFIPEAVDWSTDDQHKFDEAWRDYCDNGLADEVGDCNSANECEELADILRRLEIFGEDFTDFINDLQQAGDEHRAAEKGLDAGDYERPPMESPHERDVSEEEVKQMFLTISDALQN